jgi:hypothetical protein
MGLLPQFLEVPTRLHMKIRGSPDKRRTLHASEVDTGSMWRLWLGVMALSSGSFAATLELKTNDGRMVAGEVVLETDRGVLLRTESGNVMVPWAEIASGHTEGAASPVSAPSVSTRSTRPARTGPTLGISGGVGASPLATTSSYPSVWVAAAVAFIVHVDLGRLALRFMVPIQAGGITGGYSSGFKLFGGLEGQLRLQFSDVISSALGLQAGVAVQSSSSSSSSTGLAFAFGPTLTPIAVRFGARRSHELSLAASVQFAPVPSGVAFVGSLVAVNYAYLF